MVGLVPGIIAATSALRAMVRAHLGHGPRAKGVVFYPIGLFFIVWFGVALIVDFPLWRSKDRF